VSTGFPNVAERCADYLGSEVALRSAEARLDAFLSALSMDARNLFSLLERGKALYRDHEIVLTLQGNTVRLTHVNFLVLSIATNDGFVICSGTRDGGHSPRLTIEKGDLDIARITTVRLIEDAVDAVAQHLARRLSNEKTHA